MPLSESEGDTKIDQNVCPLCTTNMVNYGVGKCNHVVCGKCAIRMRVICLSRECPVCRQHLERVFVTKKPMMFDQLDQAKQILNSEYDILFESKQEEQYYTDLMTCKCTVCGDVSRSMSALNRHYHNVHQLMFCDLCMNNLKHFPVEFPVYTGADLVAHRKWSPDAPGRGHPLCKFCERRYYDADEWYKHLRRDHFMCHVCEREAADTTTKRMVFGDYDHLLEHCRTAHFVCEEGDCCRQTFTNVFASEAELKAHRLSYHSFTKAEVRENRRLDVEVRFTADTTADASIHRDRGGPNAGRGGGGAGRGYRKNRDPPPESSGLGLDMRNLPGMAQALEISQSVDAQNIARANGEVPYEENPQDFPTLGGHVPKFNRPGAAARPAPRASPTPNGSARAAEEDDDLWSGPKAVPQPAPAKDSKSKSNTSAVPSVGAVERTAAPANDSRNWQRVANPASLTNEDFPALSGSAGNRQTSNRSSGGVWKKGVSMSPSSTSGSTSSPNTTFHATAAVRTASALPSSQGVTNIHSHDNFPSLGSGQNRPSSTASARGSASSALPWRPSAVQPAKPAAPKSKSAAAPKLSNEDFPSLGDGSGGGGSAAGRNIPWESIIKVPPPNSGKGNKQAPPKVSPKAVSPKAPQTFERNVNNTRPPRTDDATREEPSWEPSFAEEKTGRRLTAAEAYESTAPSGQHSKVQLIREPLPTSQSAAGPARSGGFRMDDDDFPSMGGPRRNKTTDHHIDAHWGPPAMSHSDLFFDVPDVQELKQPTAPSRKQQALPNVESASDFPTLGNSKPRVDPTSTTNRGHVRDSAKKSGKKGKKNRQTRPAEPKEEEEEAEEESEVRRGPIETPFSLGDLAASLINAQYQEVPDMDQRNQILFETLSEMLGSRFESFAQSSSRYRNREITAQTYVDAIRELVSKEEVASFMPEMLVLLPDIGLQKSLLVVMEPELRRHLRECATCGQVVTSADLPFHLSVH